MNRKIGEFYKYRGFSGSIEISDKGTLKGVVKGSVPPYEYFATNIESLEEAFHSAVDEYMLNSLYYKDIKCSKELVTDCNLNCDVCMCRNCEEKETCKAGDPFWCDK